jgi:hypothetical protein
MTYVVSGFSRTSLIEQQKWQRLCDHVITMGVRALGLVFALSLFCTSCDRAPTEMSAAAAVTIEEPADAGAMAHGDHNPHHGGIVYMYKEVHYEVVLDRDGHHRVYFSDATREDLPASVASSVTLTIERPDFTPETVRAAIDEQGESWRAEGAPVAGAGATARVAFVISGEPYWIDVPFLMPKP